MSPQRYDGYETERAYHLAIPHERVVPFWLISVLFSLAGLGGGILADRVSVATTVAGLDVRVKALEQQSQITQSMHDLILEKLNDNALKLERIAVRQDEVREKLHIAN